MNTDRLLASSKDAQRRPQPIDTLYKRAGSESPWQPLRDIEAWKRSSTRTAVSGISGSPTRKSRTRASRCTRRR